jgi:hypothetical protein
MEEILLQYKCNVVGLCSIESHNQQNKNKFKPFLYTFLLCD